MALAYTVSPVGVSAPVGIRTRVAGSKGRNDWPDYTTGAILSSPERIRTAVAGSKGQNVNHYTTGPSFMRLTEGIVIFIFSILVISIFLYFLVVRSILLLCLLLFLLYLCPCVTESNGPVNYKFFSSGIWIYAKISNAFKLKSIKWF